MIKASKNDVPVLSVIVLNYNAGVYLEKCISSIDSSVLTHDIEVIFADNASTDTSLLTVKK